MQRIFFTSFDVFTFHYVSINIEIGETLKEGFRTLHSTMYLLIFAWEHHEWVVGSSLHSTMYLLILKMSSERIVLGSFTFHYVSINIASPDTTL